MHPFTSAAKRAAFLQLTTSGVLSLACIYAASASELTSAAHDGRKETIAVLGTGDMGSAFGPRLAALGYRVIYGSRAPDSTKAKALLESTGANAKAASNVTAANQADIVLLALPADHVEDIVKTLGDLDGKVVIDQTWPPTEIAEDGYDRITGTHSRAESIQKLIPQARVVKALGTLGSNVIKNPHDAGGPVTIPIAGDHRRAKEITARIVAELGLDPVDAGPLRMARALEAMMNLYMIPHYQGRSTGWEFYFRRTNYWMCNTYTGGELESGRPPLADEGNLAFMPESQPVADSCLSKSKQPAQE